MGCHALLQGIIPTQRSNPLLLHLLLWQVGSSRPDLILLFLTRLTCLHSVSITWKSWVTEMGDFHCCCHRSGSCGVSSVSPPLTVKLHGASQPHRVPGDQSRVLEKATSVVSKSYHQEVGKKEWRRVRQGRGMVEESAGNCI